MKEIIAAAGICAAVILYCGIRLGHRRTDGWKKCKGEKNECRQGKQIEGDMRQINQRSAGTVIFGRGNGKAAARRNAIICFQKKARSQGY